MKTMDENVFFFIGFYFYFFKPSSIFCSLEHSLLIKTIPSNIEFVGALLILTGACLLPMRTYFLTADIKKENDAEKDTLLDDK